MRTVFNLLGPLTNPCVADGQLIGVGQPDFAPLYADVFRKRSGKTIIVRPQDQA